MSRTFVKIWGAITLVITIILITVLLFQILLLDRSYHNKVEGELRAEAAQVISLFSTQEDSSVIYEELNDYSIAKSCSFVVFDAQYNITDLSSLRFSKSGKHLEYIMQVSKPYIESKTEFSKEVPKISNDDSFDTLIYGVPINESFYLLFIQTIEFSNEVVRILEDQFLLIAAVAFLLSVFVAFLLAKEFTTPILKISKAAEQISHGDFDIQINVRNRDEIGELAATVNEMAQRLKASSDMQKDLIANTSHELKSPVSSIMAYTELIQELEDLPEKDRDKYLSEILTSAGRLNNMINDLMEVSKIQSGNLDIHLTKVDLVEIARSVKNELFAVAATQGLELILDCPYETLIIKSDRTKLYSVFANLVSNAIKHSHTTGTIRIVIRHLGQIINVKIIDQGQGISKEDLPYIWDRFYKVDKSRRNIGTGTGLGMAIVKGIFERLEYSYSLDSAPGKGTTITFNIPVE